MVESTLEISLRQTGAALAGRVTDVFLVIELVLVFAFNKRKIFEHSFTHTGCKKPHRFSIRISARA